MQCLIKVPPSMVAELRETLEAEEGPACEHYAFTTAEFDARASAAFQEANCPPLTLMNAWSYFGIIAQNIL